MGGVRVNISNELLFGEVLVHLSGNREAVIENYKGIHLYTTTEIIISCKKQSIQICGEQLQIRYFSGCDMKITGIIHSITYHTDGTLCC